MSIAQIATRLNASKSTASYWCREIRLTNAQVRALSKRRKDAGARGRLRAAEKKRAERMHATREAMRVGARSIGRVDRRDLFILGLALYWGEGYKSGNEECGFTNSDPAAIRAFIQWLRSSYRVPISDLVARVSINASHRSRINAVERFWVGVSGIPRSQFTKPSLIKTAARKLYAHPEEHFGTLRVKVRRGTALRRQILGAIAEMKRQLTQ